MDRESKVKKRRVIISCVLIVIGISSLLFWEIWGREYVTYESVITASTDIKQGDIISEKLLKEKPFQKNNVISHAVKKEDVPNIMGMIAKQNIVKGSQLHSSYLTIPEKYIEKGESIYKLPAEWIDMRSASIRKGDVIEIYGQDGVSLGRFKVAFVKDEQEREITSLENEYQETLDRTESTGVINNIEIITTLEKYDLIKQRAAENENKVCEKFTIVQVIN